MQTAELICAECLLMIISQSEIYSQIDPQLSHVFVSIVLRDHDLHVNRKIAPFLHFKSVLQPFSFCNSAFAANKISGS